MTDAPLTSWSTTQRGGVLPSREDAETIFHGAR